MTKQSGLGDNFYVNGYDLSGDIGSISKISGGIAVSEVTAIDKSAVERLGLHRDGGIDFNAWFNPSANQAHKRLSLLPTATNIATYMRGTTLGKPSASVVARQVNYDGTRSNEGGLSFSVSEVADGYGLEWGNSLTAGIRTDGSATNGTGVDLIAASAFGLQAYLHVFAFTGTSVTIKIQESSDNGAGDAFADVVGGTFSVVNSAHVAERIATAVINVERYLRVVTTGTFSNVQFAVSVVKNEVAVSF